MLKAIVFDFDGVIADSEPLHYKALLTVAQVMGSTTTSYGLDSGRVTNALPGIQV